jgi:hypothetical protein
MKNSYLAPRGGSPTPIRLVGHVTIGSAEGCQVRVPSAEPQHALVSVTPEGYCVRDLTGRSAVFVNGGACTNHFLREGDVLRIGSDEFTFCEAIDDATPRVAVPALAQAEPPPLRPSTRTGDTGRIRKTTRGIKKITTFKTVVPQRQTSLVPLGLAGAFFGFLGLVLLGVALSKRRTVPEREAYDPAPAAAAPAAVEFGRAGAPGAAPPAG